MIYKSNKKLIGFLSLLLLTLIFTSCKSNVANNQELNNDEFQNVVKNNNTTNSDKDEGKQKIEHEGNQKIENEDKQDIEYEEKCSDIKKDLVKINNNIDLTILDMQTNDNETYYVVAQEKENGNQKLFTYKDEDNIDLILDKDKIELYLNDEFIYIYFEDSNADYKKNVSIINFNETNSLKNRYRFNNGEVNFGNTNKYYAILFNKNLTIFDKNERIYKIEFDKKNDEYSQEKVSELQIVYDLYFTQDDKDVMVASSWNTYKDVFHKINLTDFSTKTYYFEQCGFYGKENYKFDSESGNVLYVTSNAYPNYDQYENDDNDFNFLTYSNNRIPHVYDNYDKYLYLRNIYTGQMYKIDKIDTNKNNEYYYSFLNDGRIEYYNKESDEIKTLEITKIQSNDNLVYCEISGDGYTAENKVNSKASECISKYIDDKYNISSNCIFSQDFDDVSYVVVEIPNYEIESNKYENINNNTDCSHNNFSLELWKYENGKCKRLLYNQFRFSIYNIKLDSSEKYLMIQDRKGYIVKLDEDNNILYEAKYTGFSKSPNGKYTLIYNTDESFAVLENNKMIINYNYEGTDDIDTFWHVTVGDLLSYWWDKDFNTIYILPGPTTFPRADIYRVDLDKKKVTSLGSIKLFLEKTINKDSSYILYDDSVFTGDADGYYEHLYMNKKYNRYLYNFRTNEKFYLSDVIIYQSWNQDNNIITFNQSRYGGEPIELEIDISDYIDKGRVTVISNIKDQIVSKSNNTIKIEDIELGELYKTGNSYYQVVKINNIDKINKPIYELWKYENDNYERVYSDCTNILAKVRNHVLYLYCVNNNDTDNLVMKIDGSNITELCSMKADKMFLSNNSKYICFISNNGDLKVYDENDNCIINQNIYTEKLMNLFDKESLEIADCYCMKFDEHIFVTIKSNDMLADVIEVDLINKDISSTGCELDCPYDNYFINPVSGILLYQTGRPIKEIRQDCNCYTLTHDDDERSLIAINLINMKRTIIDSDNCFYLFDIEVYTDRVNFRKFKEGCSSSSGKEYYFEESFFGN
ncbi:hypothetical protein JYG23_14045 [Sedimentibacter sp. zth1]|uniref:hypothetical protein n=1 Tax=Sedimentibacter sp. zth1 TaxID=2816908 RepID=UPI001A90E3BA|nr:hypothetical protein [Sedimentibacter sp. zth1]QSX05766.1 hypothetical protein JYG23_14045 [Sedimentibacter sp. zth1]